MTDSSADNMVEIVVESALSKKAVDISVMNMSKISSVADYFIICHADSDVQVKAISNKIKDDLRDLGMKVWHEEGMKNLHWVLLDYVDVVVHVFKKEYRKFYDLERLWGDAEIELVTE